jgi:hypothetical protein
LTAPGRTDFIHSSDVSKRLLCNEMLFAWISVIWIAFIYRAGQCVRRNNYFSYVKLGKRLAQDAKAL